MTETICIVLGLWSLVTTALAGYFRRRLVRLRLDLTRGDDIFIDVGDARYFVTKVPLHKEESFLKASNLARNRSNEA